MGTFHLIAAQQVLEQSLYNIWFWLGTILVVVLLGGLVLMRVRKRYREEPPKGMPEFFTLHDIRQLLKSGQISETEFEVLRGQILKQAFSVKSKGKGPAAAPQATLEDILWPDQPPGLADGDRKQA